MGIGPGFARRRKPRYKLKPRAVRKIFADVEQLAEAATETVEWLEKAGLGEVAQPLEAALVRLAGRHMA